jgi:hypothetical protein
MSPIRHCRHCFGDCQGQCLLDDTGRCIHGGAPRLPWRLRLRLLTTRRAWHHFLWGPH